MNRPAVVTQMVDAIKEEFETLGPNDNDKFLGQYVALLHSNHSLFMSETRLNQLYDKEECFLLLNILATEQLERKVSVCRQLLAVANIIEPGLTRIRGVTLYEMHAPMLLLAERTFKAGHCTLTSFKQRVEAVRTILTEATEIFAQVENHTVTEEAMSVAADQALVQIQGWIAYVFDNT